MPIIEVSLIEGYSSELKEELLTGFSNYAIHRLEAPKEGVVAIVRDMKQDSYMRGKDHKTPVTPAQNPIEMIKDYLSSMENRDLVKASSYLSPNIVMTFPGGVDFHSLEALVEWGKGRYAWVKKKFDRFDCAYEDDGIIVTCQGTLYGEGLTGAPFENIRFMDWFLIKNGKIHLQRVWNDF